jgi:hypothetical protein
VFSTEVYIDGVLAEKPQLPVNFTTRRHELAWNYSLPKGKHTVQLKLTNPVKGEEVRAGDVIVYSDKPVNGIAANQEKAKKGAK